MAAAYSLWDLVGILSSDDGIVSIYGAIMYIIVRLGRGLAKDDTGGFLEGRCAAA